MDKTIETPVKKPLHYKDRDRLLKQRDEENRKLKEENLKLKAELAKVKKRKKIKRKDIIPDENITRIFSEFFEASLNQKKINDLKLKELEKHIKNPSDKDVLFFLIQQTILQKRVFTILTEKEIEEGKKIGYMVITPGTGLSRNTIALSLKSLKEQGLIFRYRENKHKSIFLINTEMGREIYNRLVSKECDFADIEHVLLVRGATL
jgi:hypothetical protein